MKLREMRNPEQISMSLREMRLKEKRDVTFVVSRDNPPKPFEYAPDCPEDVLNNRERER